MSLRPLGDNHSLFLTHADSEHWKKSETPAGNRPLPTVSLLEDIAYIEVPGCHSGAAQVLQQYADSLQAGLKRAYSKQPRGFVVDIRDNDGGNMEPMITGLGPLLEGPSLGALMDVEGQLEHWHYREGTYFWEEEEGMSATAPLRLETGLPIAVLTSARTGSSGEIVAISFIGNPRTRSFGQATMGLTTGNGEFPLQDGSTLLLASTKMVDRNGKVYTASIQPDVAVAETTAGKAAADPVPGGRPAMDQGTRMNQLKMV